MCAKFPEPSKAGDPWATESTDEKPTVCYNLLDGNCEAFRKVLWRCQKYERGGAEKKCSIEEGGYLKKFIIQNWFYTCGLWIEINGW